MRRAAKVDRNQAEVVDAARKIGASVAITSTIGQGIPDLIIGWRRKNYLVEVKDGSKSPSKRKLTKDQAEFHAAWRGEIIVVTSAAELVAYLTGGNDEDKGQ